jgi:hypothetical protein
MRQGIFKALAVVVLVVGFFGGLIVLGELARDSLARQERYRVPFAAIECQPPPGMTTADFLDEVQYYARFPDKFVVLDKDLSARLKDGFSKHPWVEKVLAVEMSPPRYVQVRLQYRMPVLAVSWKGEWRAVDAHGILLPRGAPTLDLPIYKGEVTPPRHPAGQPWGNPDIEKAAGVTAGVIGPRRGQK